MIICGCGGSSSGDAGQSSPAVVRNALDPNFGTGGIVETPFSSTAMLIQTDGRIVAAGSMSNGNSVITRYNSDGSIDQGFGNSGSVILYLGTNGGISGLAIQPDGKIIAVGNSFNGTDKDVAIFRISANGILDAAWGDRGQTISSVGSDEGAYGVALQSDGKIVIAGWFKLNGADSELLVARLNQDGSPDGTFGQGGVVKMATPIVNQNEGFRAQFLAIQSDGKIIVAGSVTLLYQFSMDNVSLVARFQSNGTLDGSFGTAGFFGPTTSIMGFLLQQDGKICLTVYQSTGLTWSAVARYTSDGLIDVNFGQGYQTLTSPVTYYSMAQDSHGRIVTGGQRGGTGEMTVARFQQDGTIDESFGSAGQRVFFPSQYGSTWVVMIQTDEKILVSGFYGNHDVILRYIP